MKLKEYNREMNIKKFAKEQQWEEIKMVQDNLYRFERDDFTVDIWIGKKGTTIGVHHEEISCFLKEVSEDDIVEVLVDPDYLKKNNLGKVSKRWRK